MNHVLHLLGLARKAGKLEAGEAPVGAAAQAHKAKLICLASDAADNSARRAEHFAQTGRCPLIALPFDKAQTGTAVGSPICAMLAITDAGLAAALAGKLAQCDPVQYGPIAQTLDQVAARALRRQKKARNRAGPGARRREQR